jgi:hypothetical protein
VVVSRETVDFFGGVGVVVGSDGGWVPDADDHDWWEGDDLHDVLLRWFMQHDLLLISWLKFG